MPCNSGQEYDHTDYEMRRELDQVTRLLCALLQALPENVIESGGPDLIKWRDQHKAHDEKNGRKW
jgi:hypothetical protein